MPESRILPGCIALRRSRRQWRQRPPRWDWLGGGGGDAGRQAEVFPEGWAGGRAVIQAILRGLFRCEIAGQFGAGKSNCVAVVGLPETYHGASHEQPLTIGREAYRQDIGWILVETAHFGPGFHFVYMHSM